MSVFAVVYGNNFPREVDSLWSTEDAAWMKVGEMADGWQVVEMEVDPSADIETSSPGVTLASVEAAVKENLL